MLLPGHVAAGYLVSKALIHAGNFPLSPQESNIVIAAGVISSIIPDLDLIYFFFKNKSGKLQDDKSHRTLYSHAPFLWALAGILLYIVAPTEVVKVSGLALWLGSWSHFIGDSVEYGIMWLWPFSSKQLSIRRINNKGPEEKAFVRFYWKFFWGIYVRNWTFWIELGVITLALFVYFS